jgi:RNA polymerase sigma-70 factor, ECF subfamily
MAHGLASSLTRARREPSAFGGFYAAQSRELLAFFARRTFDVEVARDLTAETFAQAFEHRRRFRGSTDAEASGWLFGIARHQLSRYARKGVVERKAIARLSIQLPAVSEEDYGRIAELAGLAQLRATAWPPASASCRTTSAMRCACASSTSAPTPRSP